MAQKDSPAGSIAEAARRVEERIRGELAALVGAAPSAEWREIGGKLEENVRGEVAELAGQKPGASWGEIEDQVDRRVKTAVGGWAGVQPEDDWVTAGRKMEAAARERAAHAAGTTDARDADWGEIGRNVEQRVRSRVAEWAGARESEPWRDVGPKLVTTVQERGKEWWRDQVEGDKPDPPKLSP